MNIHDARVLADFCCVPDTQPNSCLLSAETVSNIVYTLMSDGNDILNVHIFYRLALF